MAKNKVQELVETYESPILLEKADDGYHYADFLVTTIGQRNKNGRVYPESVIARELSQTMRNDLLGQDTHPTDTPKFTNQFLIWQKFMREGDKEYARAKVVPTFPDGENFIKLAQAGAMASCSRRGVGSVKEGTLNGQKVMIVQDDYRITGIDILPPHAQSDHNAYLTRFEAYDPNETDDESLDETVSDESVAEPTEVETPMPDKKTATPVAEEVVETANRAETAHVADTTTETVVPEPQEKQTSTPAVAQAVQTERASVTATEPQTAPVPLDVIEKLTTNIQAKDTLITQQNVKIVTLAEANAEKDAQIKAMTEAISGLNAETTRLSKAITELNGTVQERTKLIAERDATLVKRNQTLADRQALLVQAHKTIQERDEAIAERNKTITQRNGLLAVRDENIAKLQKEVAERNTTIARQDLEIQSQDATIQERDQAIAAERASLAERDVIIAQSDKELVERNAELLALNDQLLAEKVNVEAEKEKNRAFQHLFEKVQVEGEKASWFIFNDLRACATVQEVEEKFAASKARGIQLIEGVARVAGKAVYTETAPTDADELDTNGKPKTKSPKADTPATNDTAFVKSANRVASIAGL